MADTPIDEGPGYAIHTMAFPERQIDLTKYLHAEPLRPVVGFSTRELHEDIHWENFYEFLIPQDAPTAVRICSHPCECDDKGRAVGDDPVAFQTVQVKVGQLLVVLPRYCHRVIQKGRFIALKAKGYFKICAKPLPPKGSEDKGRCTYTSCSLWDDCERIYRSGRQMP